LNKDLYNLNLKDLEGEAERDEVEERCKIIGRLIGKAVLDNRIIDLSLSELTWAQILGVSPTNFR